MEKQIKGIIYLFITALIWGAAFVTQLLGGAALGSYSFVAYRGLFGCITIFLMIIILNLQRYKKLAFFLEGEDKKKTILNSCWCGVVLFFAMITQQIGVEITDVAKSGIIASLEVVCVPILLMITCGRKIKLFTWFFIILAMLGIMMLNFNSVTGLNIGDLWVFISTILYSITIIQVPKYIKDVDPLKFSFFRFFVVGIFSFILALVFKNKFMTSENLAATLPSVLFTGVMSSGIAYTFQILGQRYCEPVVATLIMGLEGVFAAIFGWILLGQTLNLLQIVGILITFASTCVVQISDMHHNLADSC